MDHLNLNDLPRWSAWPARLLGVSDDWSPRSRTKKLVAHEYDDGKYRDCLSFYEQTNGAVSPEAVQDYELAIGPDGQLCLSIGDELRLVTLQEFREAFRSMLTERLVPDATSVDSIVELGCGYGYNLWLLGQFVSEAKLVGGDYSERAVELASRLFADDPNTSVVRFDFYEGRYEPLTHAEGQMLIFTNHAVEQLPSARQMLQTLDGYRDRISTVVHFEPLLEAPHDGLLGLMRRRYIEANDYNRDLLGLLQERSDIELESVEFNVLGANPLNPTSVIRWSYR